MPWLQGPWLRVGQINDMGRLTHIYEPGMTYLITTITHRRERLFEDARHARTAHEDIAFYAHKFGMVSVAHVIMPDHMHWIMRPSPEDFERFTREEQAKGKRSKYSHAPERFYLSKILEDYKRHTAHAINEYGIPMPCHERHSRDCRVLRRRNAT